MGQPLFSIQLREQALLNGLSNGEMAEGECLVQLPCCIHSCKLGRSS